jgi:hypothetical protein
MTGAHEDLGWAIRVQPSGSPESAASLAQDDLRSQWSFVEPELARVVTPVFGNPRLRNDGVPDEEAELTSKIGDGGSRSEL